MTAEKPYVARKHPLVQDPENEFSKVFDSVRLVGYLYHHKATGLWTGMKAEHGEPTEMFTEKRAAIDWLKGLQAPVIMRTGGTMEQALIAELDEAEKKAIDNLARYKFQNFGYWAGIWVHLNRITGSKRPNPFADLVKEARRLRGDA